MCSTKVPNTRGSTVPTRKAGSRVIAATGTWASYPRYIVVNEGIGYVVARVRGEARAGPAARRRGARGGLGEDGQQRGQRLRARVARDAQAGRGVAERAQLPAQPVRTVAAPGSSRGDRPGGPGPG